MTKNYVRVVLEGNADLAKGFLLGFAAGRGLQGEIYFGSDFDLEEEGARGFLAHLVGLGEEHTVVVMAEALLDDVTAAVAARGGDLGLAVKKVELIREVEVELSFHTYSREVGGELKALLGAPPAGVTLSPPFSPEERYDPEGKGVEAYTPLHDYEISYRGRLSGPPGAVFPLAGRLNRFEVVTLKGWAFKFSDRS
ncbi:MAG TPA: hypothetical protein PK836_03080 [Syntrophales bacterium]|nr:hypothetical protein [Syntrophales bacterium]HOM06535.1 hypothetical protein [Syntrophales bacterium]HON99682.1 hypothetical protein [Syntrophales bacterium]HPC00647.1 hypothetical protein [Syntrophales bacterium]HPQ06203.1 hypothetical protein [Syntrophales bacterium]